MPCRITLALVVALALLGAGLPAPTSAANTAACVTFPETGKQVCDRFLEYWQANGGLAQQGLPLSDTFVEVNPADGKPYTVQYFERARFELHPENAAPYDVLLGLTGREQLLARYGTTSPPGLIANPLGATCATFAETGKQVCGAFLDYWGTNGGLAQQGLPLTDLLLETNPTDGKQYPTQYFERARFEFHAENLGTPYVVLLGLLGREQYLTPFLQDDFSDKRAGWQEGTTTSSEIAYRDGGYHIKVTTPKLQQGAQAPALLSLGDVRVSVDATWVSGDNQTDAAIRCRRQGAGEYYYARIFPTGVYDIAIIHSGAFHILASGHLAGALRTGLGATNRIEFACIGDTLTLGANGKALLAIRDTTFTMGGVSLVAESTTSSATGVEVRFDNFLATRP